MRNKHLALTITAIASLLTPALFADDKPTNAAPKFIRLQSNGETVAEVRLVKGAELTLQGRNTERDLKTGRTAATDATIDITVPGGKPITLKADRIEVIDNDAVKVMAMKGAARTAPMSEPKAAQHEASVDALRESLWRTLSQYEDQPVVKRVRERVPAEDVKKTE